MTRPQVECVPGPCPRCKAVRRMYWRQDASGVWRCACATCEPEGVQ